MGYVKKLTGELKEKIMSLGVRDMPQNPASQGYSAQQIREFYYLPENAILDVLMQIEDEIERVLKYSNVDDLNALVGDISNAFDSLHDYAQNIIGGDSE